MRTIREYIMITIGSISVALAVSLFLAPNNIAAGGVSGIAIIINSIEPKLTIPVLALIMNVILFAIGFLMLGNGFGVKTLYASGLITFALWILEVIIPKGYMITDNVVISAVCATLLSGFGLGTVFMNNASTGGTDIIAKILNKYLKTPIGTALMGVDFLVTLGALFVFGIEKALLGVLIILANGYVINYVIDGFKVRKQVMIFSKEVELIKEYIHTKLNRGCTILNGTGGFSGNPTFIIYTIIGRSEFLKLREYISTIDNKAFITVSEVHEVLGEGFELLIDEK